MKKPKQPDRWERVAQKDPYGDIAALLRREHRAIVRMVRQQLSHSADWGYQEAIDDILAKLKARSQ
jgi:hypothetical protein